MQGDPRGILAAEAVRGKGWAFLVVRAAAWSVIFLIAGELGAMTRLDGTLFSLIWPATAVALLWALTGGPRSWPIDAVALTVSLMVMHYRLFGIVQVLFSTTGYLLGAAVFTLACLARLPGLCRPTLRAPTTVGETAQLFVISVLAGTAQALPVSIGAHLTSGAPIVHDAMLRSWRNAATIFAVVVISGLLAEFWAARRANRPSLTLARIRSRPGEFSLILVFLAVTLTVSFGLMPTVPLSFLFLLPTAWAGLRYGRAAGVGIAFITGSVILHLTLNHIGLYASISDPGQRATIAQVIFTTAVLMGLTAAIVQEELLDERELAASRAAELDTIIAQLHDGLAVLDAQGNVQIANPAMATVFGRNFEAVREVNDGKAGLFHLDGRPIRRAEAADKRAFAGEDVHAEHVVFRDGIGEDKVLSINAALLPRRSQGEPPMVVVTVRDVTLEQRQFESLANFAGVVAHDLKAPLSVVEGWSEALAGEFAGGHPVPSVIGGPMIARIMDASVRMRGFINDLLDYTVSKDQSLKPEQLDLARLIRDVAQDVVAAGAPSSGSLYGVDADRPQPEIACGELHPVWGDPLLVRQVLANLISNGAKYVPEGQTPHIWVESALLPSGFVEISVTDDGIGIPSEQRSQVFQAFHRAHHGYSGTGLGLSICAQIVHRHGGTIWATRNPDGPGSSFKFTLPSDSDTFGIATTLEGRSHNPVVVVDHEPEADVPESVSAQNSADARS